MGGGVLGPDGKIYGIPRNSADILIIDPVAGTAIRSNMGLTTNMTNTDKWFGGVLGPDGKIYGIPRNSADILIIDPSRRNCDPLQHGTDDRDDKYRQMARWRSWS
jgi:hypothetical protein